MGCFALTYEQHEEARVETDEAVAGGHCELVHLFEALEGVLKLVAELPEQRLLALRLTKLIRTVGVWRRLAASGGRVEPAQQKVEQMKLIYRRLPTTTAVCCCCHWRRKGVFD